MDRAPAAARLNTTCPQCGGACEAQLITLTLQHTQYGFAVVRNVPAEVCQNCGESQFSMLTTGKIMSALHTDRTPDDIAIIPIYEFGAPRV